MPLLSLDEDRKLVWVANEENGGVVPDQDPVAFLGVASQREAGDVALGGVGTELAGDAGEASEYLAPGSRLQALRPTEL